MMEQLESDIIKINDDNIIVKTLVIAFKQEDNFIIYSPSLNLTAISKLSELEATEFLKNAITLFFKMHKRNTDKLSSKLKKLGWQEKTNGFFKPVTDNTVPFEIVGNNPTIKEKLEAELIC